MRQFSFFQDYPQLVHGVFDKSYGDFSPNHDSSSKVKKNLQKAAKKLEISPTDIVAVNQVHGTNIVNIKTTREKQVVRNEKVDADGLITNLPNTFLLLKTADCIPLFIFDPKKNIVGLIHVGWRGAMGKIHEKVIGKMESTFNSKRKNLLIGLGPSICAKCYITADKPQQAALHHWKKHISKKPDGWHVDLTGFVIDTLVRCKLPKKNIEMINQCTCESDKWFSHVRSKKSGESEGRFASIIGLKKISSTNYQITNKS